MVLEKKKTFWTSHTKNHKVFDPYLIIQFLFSILRITLFIYNLFLVDKNTYT